MVGDSGRSAHGRAVRAPRGVAMTDAPRRGPEKGRLLNDEEIKIWEAADQGTDDTNPAWRALREKLAAEMEQEEAEAVRQTTCTACGERCNRWLWRSFPDDAKWVSMCCRAEFPPEQKV